MKLDDVKVVSIFGAGMMGHGIAQVMAQQGFNVYLSDVKQEFLDSGINRMKASLAKAVERSKMTNDQVTALLARVKCTTDIAEAAGRADFMVEAIPEKPDMKKALYKQIDAAMKPEAILASNTSTLSITDLGSALKRPDKFVGMHFFNPVPLMALVEMVKGLLTSAETIQVTKDMVVKLGKEPVVIKDAPGFATTRLGVALYLEASRMLEEGVASCADIDKAMKLGYGHRMGPFETCDLVGLDARLNNINALWESTRDPLWKPPQLLRGLVNAGFLGKKPGSKGGYYKYFGFE